MIKTEKILKETEVIYKYCDKCSVDISKGTWLNAGKCSMCGDDLCKNCVGHTDDDYSDYQTVICKPCWEAGETNRAEIEILEKEIEKLQEDWYLKCVKNN